MANTLYWVGTIDILIGSIWLVVVGFQQSPGWGFTVLGGVCCCFILWIVFAVKHWEESKKPVLWLVLGIVLSTTGTIMGGGNLLDQAAFEELFSDLEEASEVVPVGTPSPALPEGLEIPAIGGPLAPPDQPAAAPVAETAEFTPAPAAPPPPPAVAPEPPPAAAPVAPAQPAVATPAAPAPVIAPAGEVDPRLLEPVDLLLSEAERDWNAGRRRRAVATMKNALAILKRHLGETDERVTDLQSRIELAESQVD